MESAWGNDIPNDTPAGRWMTYDEIAQARGASRDGAIRWVQRQKLRRQPGNDGRVRVLVPPGVLPTTPPQARANHPPRTDTPNAPPAAAAFEMALTAVREANAGEVAALQGEVATLRDTVEGLRSTVARAEHRAQHAEARATEAEAEATTQTARAREAEDRARQAVAGAQAALQAAETLRNTVDELKAGQGMMQNMHAGELDQARAEAQAVQERAEAAHQRDGELIANLEADLRAKDSELAEQRILTERSRQQVSEQEQAAQEALQAAHELRRADDTRKARGRLRRAWDGWRGR
jgi:hypothetical protein